MCAHMKVTNATCICCNVAQHSLCLLYEKAVAQHSAKSKRQQPPNTNKRKCVPPHAISWNSHTVCL